MISKSLEDTARIAREFLADLGMRVEKESADTGRSRAAVVALSGDLGAGKTTFAKAFAAALGIPAESVTSPTFVIEKRFDIGSHAHFKRFVHIDAYRLEKPEEIVRLGWNETLADPGNLVLIEWPENIGDALPPDSIRIRFRAVDENRREIDFK